MYKYALHEGPKDDVKTLVPFQFLYSFAFYQLSFLTICCIFQVFKSKQVQSGVQAANGISAISHLLCSSE